jgi:hypothetical protein
MIQCQLFWSLPWGKGEAGLVPKITDYPVFGEIIPEQQRKKYAPLRFRLDAGGGCHIVNQDNQSADPGSDLWIFHYSAQGDYRGKTPIGRNEDPSLRHRIIDFAVDEDSNSYILEVSGMPGGDQPQSNRLFKLSPAGEILWEREGLYQAGKSDFERLEGEFDQILLGNPPELFLTSPVQSDTIISIDSGQGKVAGFHDIKIGGGFRFISQNGLIQRVVYFSNQNRRGFAVYDPRTRQEKYDIGNESIFGLLLSPFGADDQASFYIYKTPNLFQPPGIVKINFGGEITGEAKLQDIVVGGNDQTVFTGHMEGAYIINGYFTNGTIRQWRFHPPENEASYRAGSFRLIHVTPNDQFYFLSGEEPGKPPDLLIFSKDGFQKKDFRAVRSLDVESSIQPYNYWQVDGDGNVYIPLVDPAGFKIIRLELTA